MPAMSATPPPRSQDATILLLHDARAVHDTASIRHRDYMLQGTPAWIAADILPGARSGSGTIPGASMDGTGKLRNPNNAAPEMLKEGKWKAVSNSSHAQAAASGEYAWSEEAGQAKRTPDPEDYYSPFVNGGTVIFKPVAGATGIDQFGSVHLLFDGWGKFVGPAFEYLGTHPEAFSESDLTPAVATQLAEVLRGKNPLLALLAFRHLQEAGKLKATEVDELMNSSSADLVAGICYLLLATPSLDERKLPLTEVISSHIKLVSDVAALRPIGLAAYSVQLFGSPGGPARTQVDRILATLSNRAKALGPEAEGDRYLRLIFEKSGRSH